MQQVSNVGSSGEGWDWVDALPRDKGCDPAVVADVRRPLPTFLHSCQTYEISSLKAAALRGGVAAGGGAHGNAGTTDARGAYWMFSKYQVNGRSAYHCACLYEHKPVSHTLSLYAHQVFNLQSINTSFSSHLIQKTNCIYVMGTFLYSVFCFPFFFSLSRSLEMNSNILRRKVPDEILRCPAGSEAADGLKGLGTGSKGKKLKLTTEGFLPEPPSNVSSASKVSTGI